ncbi:GNAT family N-acetyltransferase [Chitinimonas koreensis]|uniref:GNAT family N-acetyltransferase n=1 Tax=Chitinimonas koreensis TaxID=356302 RepID=UPI00042A3907|nr:GNAT family N-acetyltransferase [Chitinimonas koreensis]
MSIRLERIVVPDAAQLNAVLAVASQAPNYWLLSEGKGMPGRDAVAAWFDGRQLPPGKSIGDQQIYGIHLDDPDQTLIGIVMVLRGWPYPEQASIGLLLLAESWQGKGLGRLAYLEVEALAQRWPRIETMRIGVVASNEPAFPFWRRLGFRETGERRRDAGFLADTVVLEKPLHTPAVL